MATEYVFLSHALSTDTPTPPAIPPIELAPFMSLDKGDDANVTFVKLMTHTGTHVDTPRHVVRDGIALSDFEAGELVFKRPVVFDLPLGDDTLVMPEHLAGLEKRPWGFGGRAVDADIVMFRFGYGRVRETDPRRYSGHCPGFGVESAMALREMFPQMRALGMDVPSLSCIAYLDRTMKAHNVLLGDRRRFLVIEDMKLDMDLDGLASVIVAPLWIRDVDGGPATILGHLRQGKEEGGL
jgi:arylformamidase